MRSEFRSSNFGLQKNKNPKTFASGLKSIYYEKIITYQLSSTPVA